MDLQASQGVALRFQAYTEHLSGVVGHADRREPLAAYCTGPLLRHGMKPGCWPPCAQERAPIRAWIADDTGIQKNHFDT